MKKRIVVSDSSILICFANAGKVNLLKELVEKMTIPQAVYQEIGIKGKEKPETREILATDWIEIKSLKNQEGVKKLPRHLGKGEKEAIILAKELGGFLLIDDPSGRKEAERQGVKFTGTLGILQEAQAKKLTDKIKPILDDLIASGLRIHTKLYKEFLEKIRE